MKDLCDECRECIINRDWNGILYCNKKDCSNWYMREGKLKNIDWNKLKR